MLGRIAGAVLSLLICINSNGQTVAGWQQCAKYKTTQAAGKLTVADVVEDAYDIKHVKIDIALTNQSTDIHGVVTVQASVVVSQLDTYVFELDTMLRVDSFLLNGIKMPVSNNGHIRSAMLDVPLPHDAPFTATIYYGGTADAGNGYYQAGLNNTDANPYKIKTTYSLAEPYLAYKWWPCKQSLQDKIDSADIWITVPAGLKAGSNGLLQNIRNIAGGQQRYEWHTGYPVAYYLLAISVAPYIDYHYKIAIPGGADSLLFQNYVYDAPGALDNYKQSIDSTADMLQYFSAIFGTYPFMKEKYGHCIVPLPGGMEYQTMTSCGDFGSMLVSHELTHQWFGDHVTCATWKDVWLNEGFASYGEYLFLEHFRPKDAAAHMQQFHDAVLNKAEKHGAVYVDDTTNDGRIFDGRLSYAKAAAVIHSLRFVIDNDSLFFAMLRAYQQQFAFGNATTEQFKNLAANFVHQNLDTFFDQWIYKEGYPIYRLSWNQVNDDVFIKVQQTTAVPQSVSLYNTPLELKLKGRQGDSSLRIYNTANEQLLQLKWNNTMTGIITDPGNHILNGDLGAYHDPELGINTVTSNDIVAFPNPADNYWSIIGLAPNTDWILTDMNGRVARKGNTGSQTWDVIYTDGLARGSYVYVLLQGKKKIKSIKLIKE
ncbi:MAG: T9SS type A sorting domain-containing protein [Bacteroidetes bacterium]|nr:T9SS type A sorting domain-containing protein [Bacteroidota bacterium]